MHKFLDKKQRNNKTKFRNNIIIFIILFLFVLFGFFSFLNRTIYILGRPFWRSENNIVSSFKNMTYYLATKKYLGLQNQKLNQENQELKLVVDDYNILKNENVKLKEYFGRIGPEHKFVLGTVLLRPNRSPYDTLVIDIGSNMGIKEGDKVYADVTHPIGTISQVNPYTANVVLYSNPNTQTDVMIDGLETTVNLVGRGGGNFEMNTPHDFEVPSNAVVFLPTLNSEVIATVAGLLSKPTDLNKKYLLKTKVNIQNIKFVQVKKN